MSSEASARKVLIFGAGYVTEPVVEYLCRSADINLTLASRTLSKAEAITNRHARAKAVACDVTACSTDQLEALVCKQNLVISLLPYRYHATILTTCIHCKVHMVTGSYVLPDVEALGVEAERADIAVFCELGLDPGIDHMLACQYFDQVRAAGSKITGYVSYCGGLPAPECKDGSPLQYKFSWSPDGALRTAKNSARFIENGEIQEIKEGTLLEHVKPMQVGDMQLEGYPNRDSSKYKKLYNLPDVRELIRGTFRYRGFSTCMLGLLKIGYLDENVVEYLDEKKSHGEDFTPLNFLANLLQVTGRSEDEICAAARLKLEGNEKQFEALELLGLLKTDVKIERKESPLLTLAHFLNKGLSYKSGERDMIILNHLITSKNSDGVEKQADIRLEVYGDPNGYSAMAKTVAYPVAIGAKLVLDGKVSTRGVLRPFTRDVYEPILQDLVKEGLKATEQCSEL